MRFCYAFSQCIILKKFRSLSHLYGFLRFCLDLQTCITYNLYLLGGKLYLSPTLPSVITNRLSLFAGMDHVFTHKNEFENHRKMTADREPTSLSNLCAFFFNTVVIVVQVRITYTIMSFIIFSFIIIKCSQLFSNKAVLLPSSLHYCSWG